MFGKCVCTKINKLKFFCIIISIHVITKSLGSFHFHLLGLIMIVQQVHTCYCCCLIIIIIVIIINYYCPQKSDL